MTAKDSKRKLEDHIEKVDARIEDVGKKASEADGDLETYYREALVKLKEVKQLANDQLDRLHDTGEETWEELKDEVEEAVERLHSNLNSLVARFQDDAVDTPKAPPATAMKPPPPAMKKSGAGKGKSAGARSGKGKRR